uniref:Uncharacterized protein n=1 Tax=viral metagenome TaxID=1070528 RepID=A0A6M3J1C1_9ZZZZ
MPNEKLDRNELIASYRATNPSKSLAKIANIFSDLLGVKLTRQRVDQICRQVARDKTMAGNK